MSDLWRRHDDRHLERDIADLAKLSDKTGRLQRWPFGVLVPYLRRLQDEVCYAFSKGRPFTLPTSGQLAKITGRSKTWLYNYLVNDWLDWSDPKHVGVWGALRMLGLVWKRTIAERSRNGLGTMTERPEPGSTVSIRALLNGGGTVSERSRNDDGHTRVWFLHPTLYIPHPTSHQKQPGKPTGLSREKPKTDKLAEAVADLYGSYRESRAAYAAAKGKTYSLAAPPKWFRAGVARLLRAGNPAEDIRAVTRWWFSDCPAAMQRRGERGQKLYLTETIYRDGEGQFSARLEEAVEWSSGARHIPKTPNRSAKRDAFDAAGDLGVTFPDINSEPPDMGCIDGHYASSNENDPLPLLAGATRPH